MRGTAWDWARQHRGALLAGVVVAVGCGWILWAGGLPVVPPRAALLAVIPWTIAAHVVLYLAALYLRAHRFLWLLAAIDRHKPPPAAHVVAVSFVGYGALLLLPARSGELVRPVLLRQRGGLSGWSVAGAVVAERILDGLVVAVMAVVALRLAPSQAAPPDRIGELTLPVALLPRLVDMAVLAFAAMLGLMALLYWRRVATLGVLERWVGRTRAGGKLIAGVSRFADGLASLPSWRHMLPFLAATFAYYGLIAWACQLLLAGCGLPTMTFWRAASLTGVVHLGALLPNAPGYFGTYQLSTYAALALYQPPEAVMGQGPGFVFWLYALQVGIPLVTAVAALPAIRDRGA